MLVLQTIGSIALVVSLMLATGLRIEVHELAELRQRPRSLAWAMVLNVLLRPALAWMCARLLQLDPRVAIGVMLCAAAPGGPTSALYSNTARADLPFAAAMTILLPAIGVVTTPLILSLAVELPAGAEVPLLTMIGSLIAMQVVPLSLGMFVRRRWPRLAARLVPWAAGLANAVLAGLVVMLTALKGDLMLEISGPTWLALLGLTGLALLLGGAADRSRPASARAGALVAACRNVSVAIMLASVYFADPVTDATVLTFGFVTFTIPLGLASFWRSRS